ncbi:hypothetical protein [Prevotella sp. OH937_COT-195]|uniref:hypothetical protein n=1 Tax=Prevotella sp. OH937_COT-195 TaxID=2491051 RepID=UPI000F6485B6|nr:hypothetical protein [Prevotella sp. OH937_COT-195]RRC99089.1 hypothetical protein EII32_08635 [Prevotella sp. OH937_COT-195]
MANQNNESSGVGCGAFALIMGGVFAAIGKSWGLVLLLLGVVVIGVSIWLAYQDKAAKEKERKRKERYAQKASRLFELQEKQSGKSPISITVTTDDNAQYLYNIKGINYCGVTDSMLGDFIGTARALKSNPHDPYAIGIYRGNKRVGFLPGGNSELHTKIMSVGGSVDADGYITKSDDGGCIFYYGKVNLLGI